MKNIEEKILIVEDEMAMSETLELLLEDYGLECEIATTGEEGLQLLKKKKFKVVLVDLRLPGMNGLQFIQRAHEMNPEISFIIITGSIEFDRKEIAHIDKVSKRIFYKPVSNVSDLIEEILFLLE